MARILDLPRAVLLLALFAILAIPSGATAQQTPPLSPRDTARLDLGGGRQVVIDYGRPSMRGRAIMGELVPWNQVWRTGANAATGLTTDADLRFGGVTVPRGSYTLFTLPSPEGWLLIVNRQTGQWGTEYDPAQDQVRIPLQVSALDEPVEQFAIELVPGETGTGTLRMAWENTGLSLPFTALPAQKR